MPVRAQAFVIAAFLLSACGPEKAPPEPAIPQMSSAATTPEEVHDMTPEAKQTVIVMLGDSLTAGYMLAPDEALPDVIACRLERDGVSAKLVNAGVSGDTSANGLARYDWSVRSASPDILVIALGANDFLQGLPPETAKANIAAIIERAQSDGYKVILAGLEPRWPETSEALQDGYSRLYPDLAAQYDVPLYEGFLRGVWNEPELLQADGLHPTAEGVEVMADRLTAYLEGVLKAE